MSTPLSPRPTAPDLSQMPPTAAESSTSTSIILVIIIVASAAILSASIYILLRLLSCRFRRSLSTADDIVSLHAPPNRLHCHAPASSVLDSLPMFTFRSVTGNLTGGDCAVCLSKFEPHDQLRLLPLCCHAFHAECIDAWILSNQTCPLCRSTVISSDADVLDKILSADNRRTRNSSFRNGSSGSFRIEIGSVSRRRSAAEDMDGERQSYSIGSFEYIVDDINGYEIPAESTTHRRGISDCTTVDKDSSVGVPRPEPPGEALAAEVSSGRNWLRDYVDRLTSVSISRAMSFRSSGRFFSGSSRRSDPVSSGAEDLEANRVGEEISELFRWLSGI
ncbi:hypothetical protein F511_12109 [Dorcoceras hygrometricum]|uniref:RING-type domain-containing protein n=1 Tax=Dorcoceras hygrometricum TaxID=472368 RepID=A0A2Z7DIW8_9LAMI|nr:hypothetical protein F511_12109 [Dorcoceras hygrometricum]